jgi:predicted PurR-regulated permease PerM
MTIDPPKHDSPKWGSTTKLVIALTFVAIIAALLIKFQFILSPLALALLLAYLIQPIATLLQRARLSWGLSVSIIYLLILLLLVGLLTASGVRLVQQVQSVVTIAQDGLTRLPGLIAEVSGKVYTFGPFQFDFSHLDLNDLSSQVLGMVQPVLSRTGSLLGTLAGSAANFLGWTLFVLLVSYFTLLESGGLRERILDLQIPVYGDDVARLSRELGRIWNAFLRGQIIIFIMTVIIYTIVLGSMGVSYALGLALLAGLARFVPYVGPAMNWLVLALVAYFQVYKLFGMDPLYYTLLVIGVALVIDQIFDNLISPRIMSDALKVHPAAVLVAAIIAANLFGVLGVVVAAPILATVTLFWTYTMHKMLDLDPWPEAELRQPPPPPGGRIIASLRRFLRDLRLPRKPKA